MNRYFSTVTAVTYNIVNMHRGFFFILAWLNGTLLIVSEMYVNVWAELQSGYSNHHYNHYSICQGKRKTVRIIKSLSYND